MIQGCLVHLQRNLRGYVARKHYEELAKIMKALRESQGQEKCREHWKRLVEFVKSQNHQAGERLAAQEAEMTSLIKLGAPNTINQSLLSTNCIENSFANLRRLIGRVTRWREGCEMAHYWTGSGWGSRRMPKRIPQVLGWATRACRSIRNQTLAGSVLAVNRGRLRPGCWFK